MIQTAKLFMNGRSQAVRLPKEFRFEGQEVAIRRDPVTGDVVLAPRRRRARPGLAAASAQKSAAQVSMEAPADSRRKLSLREMFAIFDQADFSEEFFRRETQMPRKLDLF
jgi:antitoxin VapB